MSAKESAFEEGRYGVRMVLQGPWTSASARAFVANGAVEIELNYAKGWVGRDVAFLCDLEGVLAVTLIHRNIESIAPLMSLRDLRYINIATYCKSELDFGCWPKLEECLLDEWRPKAKSLYEHCGIKRLFINKWKGADDLTPFAGMRQLEGLRLYGPAQVQSLHGIEELVGLQYFEVAVARRLASLRGLERLCNLKRLEIHTCRKIESIEALAGLEGLEELFLCDCGDIASLQPLARMRALKTLSFAETTNVVDGDLSVLDSLPLLSSVSFMDRSHYSHKRESLPAG